MATIDQRTLPEQAREELLSNLCCAISLSPANEDVRKVQDVLSDICPNFVGMYQMQTPSDPSNHAERNENYVTRSMERSGQNETGKRSPDCVSWGA
eukprot:CAMPEP_0183326694 /NCGR_PEP_ID=MMETSP0160_2-20130417/82892_1 /TAXON_ID=2839 ORGANISM="Odontella Sinensis, Strain Grunow 1884" /NCGR_SAMPLE_ID=MMETSP0160_2 /ASSEMBLY_ACC=CAM_ASM_000250 /LENGTH=95 /DNA_ID=CAMNT_0025494739 /DNA_START=192 /DNA_END=479 /DNA_ORIENTATION=-